MSNALGIWNTTWRKQGADFPREKILKNGNEKYFVEKDIVDYIYCGIDLILLRPFIASIIDGELIGSPKIMCDDRFIWSLEYAYYVKIGALEINKNFLDHIKQNNCTVPVLNMDDKQYINNLLIQTGFLEIFELHE